MNIRVRDDEYGLLDVNLKIQVQVGTTDDMRLVVIGTDGKVLFGCETASDMERLLEERIERVLDNASLKPVRMVTV